MRQWIDLINESIQLNESMSFYPYVKKDTPDGPLWDWVFPREWLKPSLNDPYSDQDEEEIPNPEYRNDLDLNITNRNAKIVMDALGFQFENGQYPVIPIDKFINIARRWLQTHIDKPSSGLDHTTNETDDELMIQAQTQIEHADTFIRKMVSKQLEKDFPRQGGWTDDDWRRHENILNDLVYKLKQKMIDSLFRKKKEERGARIFDFGLSPGYINQKILKMVKIAEEGKKMGATVVCFA